jgi:hypothetical protein
LSDLEKIVGAMSPLSKSFGPGDPAEYY